MGFGRGDEKEILSYDRKKPIILLRYKFSQQNYSRTNAVITK